MAIRLPNGFKIGSIEPIDTRLVLTKAEMLSIDENTMPEQYFAICKDDNSLYIFDKENEVLAEIGKFRLYSMSTESIAEKLPGAILQAMQMEGGAEEVLEAMFNTEHFQKTIDNKIDIAIETIQAIGPAE